MGPKGKKDKEPLSKCTKFIYAKNRFCKLVAMGDGSYCGEHLALGEEITLADGTVTKRMECPFDRNHTCFSHALEGHKKVCNSRPPQEIPEYLHIGRNKNFNFTEGMYGDLKMYENLLQYEEIKDNDQLVSEMIKILLETYTFWYPMGSQSIPVITDVHPTVQSHLEGKQVGKKSRKHLTQIGSIINLLEINGLLQNNTLFVEFGGGRAAVTFHLAEAVQAKGLQNCRFLVFDRASPRNKFDNKVENAVRIRVNIEDLQLDALDVVNDPSIKNIVGITKHLCGSATDSALFALIDSALNRQWRKIKGFCFTTCCHHRCDVGSFVGFYNATGTEKHFQVVKKGFDFYKNISSWITSGNEDLIAEKINLTDETKEAIKKASDQCNDDFTKKSRLGHAAKIVLDRCRLEYVKEMFCSSEGHLVKYVDESITPDCYALVSSKIGARNQQNKDQAHQPAGADNVVEEPKGA